MSVQWVGKDVTTNGLRGCDAKDRLLAGESFSSMAISFSLIEKDRGAC